MEANWMEWCKAHADASEALMRTFNCEQVNDEWVAYTSFLGHTYLAKGSFEREARIKLLNVVQQRIKNL